MADLTVEEADLRRLESLCDVLEQREGVPNQHFNPTLNGDAAAFRRILSRLTTEPVVSHGADLVSNKHVCSSSVSDKPQPVRGGEVNEARARLTKLADQREESSKREREPKLSGSAVVVSYNDLRTVLAALQPPPADAEVGRLHAEIAELVEERNDLTFDRDGFEELLRISRERVKVLEEELSGADVSKVHVHDDEWEVTHSGKDVNLLTEELEPGETMEVHRLLQIESEWAANGPVSWDEDVISDWEVRYFPTRDEAEKWALHGSSQAALKEPERHG